MTDFCSDSFWSKAKYWLILSIPVIFVGAFYWHLKYQGEERIVNYFGTFGDSFGVLTCLFSGLAFAGMIITLLMQKEELALQRKEFELNREEIAKGNSAQEKIARISAMSTIISARTSKLEILRHQLNISSGEIHEKLNIQYLELNLEIESLTDGLQNMIREDSYLDN